MESGKKVPIIIDNNLKVPIDYLNSTIKFFLEEALLIPNPAYIKAKKERVSVVKINKFIRNYSYEGNYLIIPRGFGTKLKEGLATFNLECDWKDHRTTNEINLNIETELKLRSHQEEPINKLMSAQQGMYEALPGAGKTVVCLELFRRLNQKTLVIVDKKNIAEQWRQRAKEHLGVDAGLIGDDNFIEKPLTIALVQTLNYINNKLPPDTAKKFFAKWGMVMVDECHHSAADTWRKTVESFPAKYRFGVSATPDRENGMFEISELVLGPIVHRTSNEELYENKTIMKPFMKVVATDFDHCYFPTHSSGTCQYKPDCKGTKSVHRNNYQQILTKLSEDEDRATLVVNNILDNKNKNNIVISKRIKHLNLIKELLLPYTSRIHMLTGKETTEERSAVVDLAMKGKIIILSTLADEALDIPTLEVIHLTWPTRSIPLLRQQIGRVQRFHPDKENPLVFDYVDRSIPPLKSQWNARRDHYLNSQYKIEFIGDQWPGNGLASVL